MSRALASSPAAKSRACTPSVGHCLKEYCVYASYLDAATCSTDTDKIKGQVQIARVKKRDGLACMILSRTYIYSSMGNLYTGLQARSKDQEILEEGGGAGPSLLPRGDHE